MALDTKLFVLVMMGVVALGVTCLAGETPNICCKWEKTDSVADRCEKEGVFKSESKCFKQNKIKTDRSDYFVCTNCGTTICMARMTCPQTCLEYLNGENCDCWNYYSESSGKCDNEPTTTLPPCKNATTTTTPTPSV